MLAHFHLVAGVPAFGSVENVPTLVVADVRWRDHRYERRCFIMSLGLSRGQFVALAASASGVAEFGGVASAQTSLASDHPRVDASVPFDFDLAAFRAVLERPYPHRQLAAPATFAAATVVVAHFRNALAAYADPKGFAAGPNSLHCAAALYMGRSINMVLDDAIYAKYPIGLMDDIEMRPADLSVRPIWEAMRHNPMADTVKSVTDQGASFFVCNHGLSGLAYELATQTAPKETAVTRDQVVAIHAELANHFLPGTMLVPAGVAAVIAAQEARFTFLP